MGIFVKGLMPMLYRFTSRSVADLIMLGPHAQYLLKAMGKEPTAQGIITWPEMAGAIHALQQVLDAEHEPARPAEPVVKGDDEDETAPAETVSWSRRAVPLLDMLRRSEQAQHDVLWRT